VEISRQNEGQDKNNFRYIISGFLHKPLLMVWTDTCDFTKFDRRTRYLSLDEDVSVADVVDKLQNMKREVLKQIPCPAIKLGKITCICPNHQQW
jgi:hypothetical protein